MDAMIAAIATSFAQEPGIAVEQYGPVILVYAELKEWCENLEKNSTAAPHPLDYRDMFFVELNGDGFDVRITDKESVRFELADPTCFKKAAQLILERAYSQ